MKSTIGNNVTVSPAFSHGSCLHGTMVRDLTVSHDVYVWRGCAVPPGGYLP